MKMFTVPAGLTPVEQKKRIEEQLTALGFRQNWSSPVTKKESSTEGSSTVLRWDRAVELWFRGPEENVLVLTTYEKEDVPCSTAVFFQDTMVEEYKLR